MESVRIYTLEDYNTMAENCSLWLSDKPSAYEISTGTRFGCISGSSDNLVEPYWQQIDVIVLLTSASGPPYGTRTNKNRVLKPFRKKFYRFEHDIGG
jgi:hypothetical protein